VWILPKQLHISPYVPDMKALGLDCEEFGRMSEKSLMWRSKPSQSRTWCQRWKRVKYMKLLSGRILKPSHSSSFVDTLLSCQPDSPVSRLVLPEDETQQKIQDIYTHISNRRSKTSIPIYRQRNLPMRAKLRCSRKRRRNHQQ